MLYTDPARGELDMVFQFEHVDLDSGPRGKWDIVPMTMLDLKRSLGPLAGRPRRGRLEQPLPRQPRPAALREPVRQRRARAPRAVGQGAGDRAAPAPRDAVRLPGRRARPAQRRASPASTSCATSSRSTTTPRRSRAARTPTTVMAALSAQGPRQRARADAVGRLADGRVHDRYAVDRRAPAVGDGQRRRPGRRPRLGVRPLPAADRAAARRARGRPRHVPDAAARRRAGVRVRARARRRPAARRGQPVRRAPTWSPDLAEAPYDAADLVLGSVPGSTPSPTDPLAAWESRVYRLR